MMSMPPSTPSLGSPRKHTKTSRWRGVHQITGASSRREILASRKLNRFEHGRDLAECHRFGSEFERSVIMHLLRGTQERSEGCSREGTSYTDAPDSQGR